MDRGVKNPIFCGHHKWMAPNHCITRLLAGTFESTSCYYGLGLLVRGVIETGISEYFSVKPIHHHHHHHHHHHQSVFVSLYHMSNHTITINTVLALIAGLETERTTQHHRRTRTSSLLLDKLIEKVSFFNLKPKANKASAHRNNYELLC